MWTFLWYQIIHGDPLSNRSPKRIEIGEEISCSEKKVAEKKIATKEDVSIIAKNKGEG